MNENLLIYNDSFNKVNSNERVLNCNPSKLLIVLSKGGEKRGYLNIIENLTKQNLSEAKKYYVDRYPTLSEIEESTKYFQEKKIETIIGIGGGSVLDSSKVLSAVIGLDPSFTIKEMINSPNILNSREDVDLILIPTTAGTGSESTQFATIWSLNEKKKYSLDHESLLPKNIFFIPELISSNSIDTLMFTALDTISHSLESLWNKNRSEESIFYSTESMNHSIANYKIDFSDLQYDMEALKSMQISSYFAGKSINITRTSIAHSISYPLTIEHTVPHGLACGFTLPVIYEAVKDELNLDNEVIELIEKIISYLNNLELKNQISNYLTKKQALKLVPNMNTKERSSNFIKLVDEELIKNVIENSF